MKKSQVSFEFIVLFALLLFLFIAIAYFLPESIQKSSSTRGIAENLAKDIKVKLISASLSRSDYSTQVLIPKKINDASISIELYAFPDNMVLIKEKDGELLARAFLPEIDSISYAGGSGDIRNFTIKKETATNTLTVEAVKE